MKAYSRYEFQYKCRLFLVNSARERLGSFSFFTLRKKFSRFHPPVEQQMGGKLKFLRFDCVFGFARFFVPSKIQPARHGFHHLRSLALVCEEMCTCNEKI